MSERRNGIFLSIDNNEEALEAIQFIINQFQLDNVVIVPTLDMSKKQRMRLERGESYLPDYMLDDNGNVREGIWF